AERSSNQWQCFDRLLQEVREAGLGAHMWHMANSAAIFRFPAAGYDMVRPGIALYGYSNFPDHRAEGLQPVLDLYAPVVMTKQLPRGHACGYGPDFITRRRTRVGLVAAGYVDGYSRRLSNIGQVDVDGRLAPVLGRVSMDTIIVDLTHLPLADVGSQVRLISRRRKDPHSVQSIARQLNTIPHEVTCALGRRVERCLVA
ncbi:MAG: alanine racemase, partial [Kiritimatiellia bacterium]